MTTDIFTGQEISIGGNDYLVVLVPKCDVCGDEQVIADAEDSHYDTLSHKYELIDSIYGIGKTNVNV